jgi:hypothetical protein
LVQALVYKPSWPGRRSPDHCQRRHRRLLDQPRERQLLRGNSTTYPTAPPNIRPQRAWGIGACRATRMVQAAVSESVPIGRNPDIREDILATYARPGTRTGRTAHRSAELAR